MIREGVCTGDKGGYTLVSVKFELECYCAASPAVLIHVLLQLSCYVCKLIKDSL